MPTALASSGLDELRADVRKYKWYHSIDFGNGVISPGRGPLPRLKALSDIYFADGVAGKTVLDIGCWDGYHSFEAKRRGATRVLATDHFSWSKECWGNRAAFELARKHLAPDVEVRDIDVPEITVDSVGQFDVVLFLNVIYHVRHPLLLLERIAPIAKGMIIVASGLALENVGVPAMYFHAEKVHPTRWWVPNGLCIKAMLKDVGFKKVESKIDPTIKGRGIFIAHR